MIVRGTTETRDELTGNFGSALEDTSISDYRLIALFAEKTLNAIFGVLQHYLPTAVIFERPVIVPKRRSRHSSTAALIGFTNDGHAARSSAKPAAQSRGPPPSKSSSSPRGTLVAARCGNCGA